MINIYNNNRGKCFWDTLYIEINSNYLFHVYVPWKQINVSSILNRYRYKTKYIYIYFFYKGGSIFSNMRIYTEVSLSSNSS